MKPYSPSDIEAKWQHTWEQTKLYRATSGDSRQKYYLLVEFPYPSGDGLHVGHVRSYTALDIMARHKRMQGFNVLYPMGWDAFGLPTENYAIKHKLRPQDATAVNVANFERQMMALGLSFDWDRAINTTDPSYYRWTQWIFLRFLDKGLAYQAEIPINWCPFEKTGLANEEVVNGLHERCGTPVEKKTLNQWMLKITAYADRLIEDLTTVDYSDRIASQQINWIGRSEGAEIDFEAGGEKLTVYTTRPDTLVGATFMVLAPEHAAVEKITIKDQRQAVDAYVKQAQGETEVRRQETDRPKTGVWTGAYTSNPLTGEKMPIWIADYVLAGYGTGAIMAVPAHDQRDADFAKAFDLPVIEVDESLAWEGIGRKTVNYKLRDWIFSRQHYWGEPIPVVHCAKDGVVPVHEDQLPVTLPEVEFYEPTETGESPLAAITDWVNTECPKCGGPAKRETDTMPNWAGSSWYFLRYTDARNDDAFAGAESLKYWMNVDLYNGGMEHTTLHLLYSRFWHKFLYDEGLVPTSEPYAKRRSHGMILGPDGRKMSKSIGNVINPDHVVERYGADALRLYEMFMGPFEDQTAWSDERLNGVSRFLHRVWTLAQELIANSQQIEVVDGDAGEVATLVDRQTHKTLKKVGHDIESMHFNTMVSALMEYVNTLTGVKVRSELVRPDNSALAQRTVRALVLMLAPVVPHVAEELWQQLGESESVHVAAWPKYDPALIEDDLVEIVVQVNGKLRANLVMPVEATEDELTNAAKADANVAKYLAEGSLVKTIVVPRRLVNFVVK
jgi:leucyl-tRNA synthetase